MLRGIKMTTSIGKMTSNYFINIMHIQYLLNSEIDISSFTEHIYKIKRYWDGSK